MQSGKLKVPRGLDKEQTCPWSNDTDPQSCHNCHWHPVCPRFGWSRKCHLHGWSWRQHCLGLEVHRLVAFCFVRCVSRMFTLHGLIGSHVMYSYFTIQQNTAVLQEPGLHTVGALTATTTTKMMILIIHSSVTCEGGRCSCAQARLYLRVLSNCTNCFYSFCEDENATKA